MGFARRSVLTPEPVPFLLLASAPDEDAQAGCGGITCAGSRPSLPAPGGSCAPCSFPFSLALRLVCPRAPG